jgi:hypothetical protein
VEPRIGPDSNDGPLAMPANIAARVVVNGRGKTHLTYYDMVLKCFIMKVLLVFLGSATIN